MEKAQAETGTRRRRTAEELLEDVRRKKEQLAAREKQLLARASGQRRKAETHAKILAGAAVIDAVKENESLALFIFRGRQNDYKIVRLAFPCLPELSWEAVSDDVSTQKLNAALARMGISTSQPSSLQKK